MCRLDQLLHQNRFLSTAHYRCSQFCSVHIGDFVLDCGTDGDHSYTNCEPEHLSSATSASNPVISIVLPVYNGQKYILDALQSIKHSTAVAKLKTEIVVVDDGSTDLSASIVRGKVIMIHDNPD